MAIAGDDGDLAAGLHHRIDRRPRQNRIPQPLEVNHDRQHIFGHRIAMGRHLQGLARLLLITGKRRRQPI